jgi:hypothetical protein
MAEQKTARWLNVNGLCAGAQLLFDVSHGLGWEKRNWLEVLGFDSKVEIAVSKIRLVPPIPAWEMA